MGLHFGTAGVRAPLGPGPDRLNADTVARVVTAIARCLLDGYEPGRTVVVAGDARHGSAEFVAIASTVLTDHGLRVLTPGTAVPTPVLAAAVRSRRAVAGLQVTASHNPAGDNGIKLYGADGAQIVPPTDTVIESYLADATAEGVCAPSPRTGGVEVDPSLVDDYLAAVRSALPTVHRSPRVALTPMHGVGGEPTVRLLAALGVDDVTVVPEQALPDPDFPTVGSPNPERPEAVARVLALAERIDAEVVLALDPDADRCATGLRGRDGRWQMLDGDATGTLLADHLLGGAPVARTDPSGPGGLPVVASTVVSSRLPSLLVPARGGRHERTPTGFKWLVRAGDPLLYAYEEAIGHCVLPGVVADKDGMSAAALWCHLAAGTVGPEERLDGLHREFGLHLRDNGAVRLDPGADPALALRRAGATLASLGTVTELPGTPGIRVDLAGGRALLRPSGTEPLLKSYCEVWSGPGPDRRDRDDTERRLRRLADAVHAAVR